MTADLPSGVQEGCLLLTVTLAGPTPPACAQLVAEKELEQGALSIRQRPDGSLEACLELRRADADASRIAISSCRLVTLAPSLCIAEVQWRAPDFLALCIDGTMVATTEAGRPVPAFLAIGACGSPAETD
ncbi:hypothetical protein SAMN06265365_103183 [Tistlia consotensis]|uniref:Uncharacterized protein n=1 Tax=Tistlia consotensis USBA 355 TaxID=560819 RepID=A0A1Y6BKJ5_9PROT|nr:hypothetical protein [Tistlia consotensis]SMF16371.1 hypothetical protein SAMN05428998_10644 [Tistlia consotensis USBA 355]SNR41186.1 hypothetical protein SAMN06265365_103183 [Tistlia consotensis]